MDHGREPLIFLKSQSPLLLVMIFTGASFHLTLIEAVYPLVTLFFFSLGVGLLLAAATVFFRAIMHIWSAVSYTHLDVYKRQPWARRWAHCWAVCSAQ